jgi:hypothetical protein
MGKPYLGLVLLLALLLFGVVTTTALAQRPANKPRVPPGVDPGGVAVAISGGGFDYTDPEISSRLARDGEGELLGWDFVDGDRRPAGSCLRQPNRSCSTSTVQTLAGSPGRSRLILLRVAAEQPNSLVSAVQFAAQAPARIVLFAFDERLPSMIEFMLDAAPRFPNLLFVGALPMKDARSNGDSLPGNLLLVPEQEVGMHRASGLAGAAWLTALAAAIASNEPIENGAALKKRLIARASPSEAR